MVGKQVGTVGEMLAVVLLEPETSDLSFVRTVAVTGMVIRQN